MNKGSLNLRIFDTHQEYGSAVARLNEAQILQMNTCGNWSVKDVIVHITWYEREMLGMLMDRALSGSVLWNLALEERNAVIYAANRDRPLSEIMAESKQVHRSMIEYLDNLSDDDLIDASCIRGMPAEWTPWEVIASNTFEHYPDHTADIHKTFLQANAELPNPPIG